MGYRRSVMTRDRLERDQIWITNGGFSIVGIAYSKLHQCKLYCKCLYISLMSALWNDTGKVTRFVASIYESMSFPEYDVNTNYHLPLFCKYPPAG